MAALSCFSEAMSLQSLHSTNISRLINGLVKSGTMEPMRRSKVMPVENFVSMFASWPGNYLLSIDKLCLKCLTLLALVAMMRPSDAAPMSVVYDGDTD